jgi:mitogen-activated protein kinase kinase kinase
MSEVTVVPQRSVEDENSNDTARQKDWTAIMGDLIGNAKGPAAGIAGGTGPADEEEEATLFLPPSANSSLSRRQVVRSPPSKPMLTVDTRTNSPSQPQTDSATDSETETGGSRVQRGKSFARPEPGQWHTRPEPEQLYDRLDKYFPKVDLDQPIVDNPASTPSTPGESGPTTPAGPGTGSGLPPPPVHPSRAPTSATTYEPAMLSPRTENVPRVPPVHPSRFNKAENRKSIRVMADHKRKTLLKNSHSEQQPKETSTSAGKDGGKDKDEMKLSRRMSMWGHRVVEVTASKLNLGQIPFSTPESPAETEDSKPQTLNWVKGELIGKGSYGRVYIALNISTGDMMAVKQVELPATERDRNDRKQLGQIESLRVEIALLKDMYHPNIVAYLGFETSPEYLSM